MGQDIGHNNSYSPQDPNNWKSIGFFNGDSDLTFTFKKLEKITAALYLVSGLFKDNEPLKWEIREKAISLLSVSVTLNNIEPTDKNNAIQAFFTVSLETVSLLNIACFSGLISDMNYRILKQEIEGLVNLIKRKLTEDTVGAGYILSDSFFKTDMKTEQPISEKDNKGHFDAVKDISKKHPTEFKRNTYSEKGIVKDKKNDRQEVIIGLLQKQSELTVKDFVQVIRGCSEKTIQRELLGLIEKGLVKKEGERRWSRYSLLK